MQQADILVKKTDSMEKKGVWFIFCIVPGMSFFYQMFFSGGGGGENYLYLKQYLIFRTLPPNLSCPGGQILWDKEINHSDMVECVEEQSTCKVFNGKFLYNQGIHCSLFTHIKM